MNSQQKEIFKKRDDLYKELKNLDKNRTEVEKQIDKVISKITRIEERERLPKIYYPPLGIFVVADELVEYEVFFSGKCPDISTELTSLF